MTKAARKLALAISACAMCAISSPAFSSVIFAMDDTYTTVENMTLTVPAPGVLSNDQFQSGDSVSAFLDTPPADGMLTFNSDGSFTYTPKPNSTVTEFFTYHDFDSTLGGISDSATVEIDFTATPLPATLPLFATGIGGLGLLGWRRNRKAQAVA